MRSAIDSYVREVERLLPGDRGVRKDLIAELRDGLDDAAEAYRHSGLDGRLAELRAVRDAGDTDVVAASYHAELAASHGQRTAALIGLSLPAVVLAWTGMWRLGGDLEVARQWPVSELTMALSRVVDWAAYIGGVSALAGLAALIWAARRGRATGWVVKAVALASGTFLLVHVGSNIVMNALLIEGGVDAGMLFSLSPAGLLGVLTMALTVVQARSVWRTLKISFNRRARTG
ncbi:permease prefix domain 1-containing protein [Flindersiella endophytica]